MTVVAALSELSISVLGITPAFVDPTVTADLPTCGIIVARDANTTVYMQANTGM